MSGFAAFIRSVLGGLDLLRFSEGFRLPQGDPYRPIRSALDFVDPLDLDPDTRIRVADAFRKDSVQLNALLASSPNGLDPRRELKSWFIATEEALFREFSEPLRQAAGLAAPIARGDAWQGDPRLFDELSARVNSVFHRFVRSLEFYERSTPDWDLETKTASHGFRHEMANLVFPVSGLLQLLAFGQPENRPEHATHLTGQIALLQNTLRFYRGGREPEEYFASLRDFFRAKLGDPEWRLAGLNLGALGLDGPRSQKAAMILREIFMSAFKAAETRKISPVIRLEQVKNGFIMTDNAGGFREKSPAELAAQARQREARGFGGLGSRINAQILHEEKWMLVREPYTAGEAAGTRTGLLFPGQKALPIRRPSLARSRTQPPPVAETPQLQARATYAHRSALRASGSRRSLFQGSGRPIRHFGAKPGRG